MRDEVYLRGSVVTWYSQNHWRRAPPPNNSGQIAQSWPENSPPEHVAADEKRRSGIPHRPSRGAADYHGTLPGSRRSVLHLAAGRTRRRQICSTSRPAAGCCGGPDWSGEPRGGNFKCEVVTSGLVDGHQAPLVPASREVRVSPYLQMPGDRSPLPRLTALAARWLRESGLPLHKHYEVARWFEQQLSSSGQFQYTLQGPERDTSIDAIEDFVSNNPRGHCEYFATALALMLRSQGIPSRVVLGYRCDEWHEDQQCYQVRQLHAHAWVEAFLDRDQIPEELRRSEPDRWKHGGWLRLDPTPAAEVGTQAAERTMWGAWQGAGTACNAPGTSTSWTWIATGNASRSMSRFPGRRETSTSKLFNPRWWRELAAGLWASLAAMLRSGIMGWLFGVVVLIAMVIVPVAVGWWLVRGLRTALAAVLRARRPAAGRGAEFDRVLPPLRADCCPLRLAAGRRADAPRVRPRRRHSAGRGQRAGRTVRAGHAGGRGLLPRPLRPAGVGRRGRADRAAGLGGIDGRRRKTFATGLDTLVAA